MMLYNDVIPDGKSAYYDEFNKMKQWYKGPLAVVMGITVYRWIWFW